MIKTPDRIADLIGAIERGEPVDLRQVAMLQALDLVHAGRQFVEEAVARDEELDRAIEQQFKAAHA